MPELYPAIEPYNSYYFPVSDGHELYVEEVGNPQGTPVVFLHGGPGGGISPKHRQLFDPAFYRIILFDQRGAGQSKPHASLENNTTWHLVSDIEALRTHLGIERWLAFGGSWGSTLSLAYAETHPERVTGLILRGIFLCRPEEIRWFYQEGCHWIYPDLWQEYITPIPPEERHDFVTAFYKRLTNPDPAIHLPAARAWSRWEGATCKLVPNPNTIAHFEADAFALAMARIECHYFYHGCFFREPNQLLSDAHKIRHIPTWIIHGRYDVVCPVKSAFDLYAELPDARFKIIPDAGHAFDEPGILNALMEATESFKSMKTAAAV